MSQKPKKPRLDRSDDSDYSDQEISIHASYEDEFTISSPRSREGRGDTGITYKFIVNIKVRVVVQLMCICGWSL